MPSLLVVFAAVAGVWPAANARSLPPSATAGEGTSLEGTRVAVHRGGDAAVLLFFLATDCPVSNRYLPEMKRIAAEFQSRGVRSWFVYPNVTDTDAGIRRHQALYGGDPAKLQNVLIDAQQQLAKLADAHVTPEAAVLVVNRGALRPVYTGRIDDRYLNLGTERPQASHHDLEEAIRAVLAHQPAPPPGGPPVGCGIVDRQ